MSALHSRLLLLAACIACCLLSWRRAADASLSFDEAFSWKAVEGRSPGDVVAATARDVHPPLYYLLLRGWTHIFGIAPIALRSLSTLFAVLCVCGVYALGCEASASRASGDEGRRRARSAGLICAALAVANPSLAYFSQVARMYSLAALLSVLSGLLLMRALTRDSRRRAIWAAYAFAITALLYTHNYGLFVFASEVVFTAAYLLHRAMRRQWAPHDDGTLRAGVLSCACVLAAYSPWLKALLLQSEQVRSSYWISAADFSTPFTVWYELLFAPRTRPGPFGGHAWPLQCLFCGLPLGIAAICLRRPRFATTYFLSIAAETTAFAFLASVCVTPILVARYLLVALPFFLSAAGSLLATVADRTLRLGVLASAVSLGLHAFYSATSSTVAISSSGAARAAAFVESHRQANEHVLVIGPDLYLRYQYYSTDRRTPRLLAEPQEVTHYGGAPVLDACDYAPPDAIRSARGRVWIVSWAATPYAPRALTRVLRSWQRDNIETFLDPQPGHNVYVTTYLASSAENGVDP